MIKNLYSFLHNHSVGTIRLLYLSVLVGSLTGIDMVFKCIVLICCAISLTIQIGTDQRWYKEKEMKEENKEQKNG